MASPTRKTLSLQEKKIILDNYKEKKSISTISNIVRRSKSVVHRVIARYKNKNTLEASPKTGRPPKTSQREDRIMVRQALSDRFKSATSISRDFNEQTGKNISRKTVSRRLAAAGLHARVPVSKPLISKKNKNSRLKFAHEHVVWTDEQWAKVHFSDESKFNLFGSDGKKHVRRKAGERLSSKCVKKTLKFGGGSVMVWGMISSEGVGPLVRIYGRVNAETYKQLLQQHVIESLRLSPNQPSIFMQDNAPCHKAKKVISYLEEEEIRVMDWPAQSPDLNPIENVWKMIGERAQTRNPQNQNHLWDLLKEEWEKINPEFCKKLIQSCGRRCSEVIKNKGMFTKY